MAKVKPSFPSILHWYHDDTGDDTHDDTDDVNDNDTDDDTDDDSDDGTDDDADDGSNCGECKYNQCTSKRHWHGCHRRELQKVPVPVNYQCLGWTSLDTRVE